MDLINTQEALAPYQIFIKNHNLRKSLIFNVVLVLQIFTSKNLAGCSQRAQTVSMFTKSSTPFFSKKLSSRLHVTVFLHFEFCGIFSIVHSFTCILLCCFCCISKTKHLTQHFSKCIKIKHTTFRFQICGRIGKERTLVERTLYANCVFLLTLKIFRFFSRIPTAFLIVNRNTLSPTTCALMIVILEVFLLLLRDRESCKLGFQRVNR